MVRFTFTSGKVVEYDYEWNKLAPKLQYGGMRLFGPVPGVLIPLNSHTIALIEDTTPKEETRDAIVAQETAVESVFDEAKEEAKTEVDAKEEPKKEVKDMTNDERLAIMKELSSCTHEEYDMYYQEVKAGPKGNQKIQQRFFPVCTKCGVRERYVKADSLTDEQKENAKLWDR